MSPVATVKTLKIDGRDVSGRFISGSHAEIGGIRRERRGKQGGERQPCHDQFGFHASALLLRAIARTF